MAEICPFFIYLFYFPGCLSGFYLMSSHQMSSYRSLLPVHLRR